MTNVNTLKPQRDTQAENLAARNALVAQKEIGFYVIGGTGFRGGRVRLEPTSGKIKHGPNEMIVFQNGKELEKTIMVNFNQSGSKAMTTCYWTMHRELERIGVMGNESNIVSISSTGFTFNETIEADYQAANRAKAYL